MIVSVPDALNLGGHKINICTDFKYLFVIFSKSRHFHQAMKHNVDQARKAMHILFKRIRNLNLPIDLQLHLFDHVILSIALYGCEIWSFENSQNVRVSENLHNDFLRHIVGLEKVHRLYVTHRIRASSNTNQ